MSDTVRRRGRPKGSGNKLAVDTTYAAIIRHRLQTAGDDYGPLSIRGLAKRVDCSYEQVRKVCIGQPVVGEDLNRRLCQELGLDEQTMWKKARAEKFERRYGTPRPSEAELPSDLAELWNQLLPEERERIQQAMQSVIWLRQAGEAHAAALNAEFGVTRRDGPERR